MQLSPSFTNLVSPSSWFIDEEHALKFVTDIHFLTHEFHWPDLLTPKGGFLSSFPKGIFLLRLDTIRRWNAYATAHKEYDDGTVGSVYPYASVLSSPCGIGKSYEAHFFALLALKCGWFVEYVGNAFKWIDSQDTNKSAGLYLAMVSALNTGLLTNYDAPCACTKKIGGKQFHQLPLRDLIALGLCPDNEEHATDVATAVEYELSRWIATPVVRIIDSHNALWMWLPDDLRAWPAYFKLYSEFETLKGSRIISIFAGSQHHKFEDKIPSRTNACIVPLYPFLPDEMARLSELPQYPQFLRDNATWVFNLTGLMPCDIALLVDICLPNLERRGMEFTLDGVEIEFDRVRKLKMEEAHRLYMKEIEDQPMSVTKWVDSARDLLFHDKSSFTSAFLDRGLLHYNRDGHLDFVNKPAREIIRRSYVELAAHFRSESVERMHMILEEMEGNSACSGIYEEIFWEESLRGLTLHMTDEKGNHSVTGVSLVNMEKVHDFAKLKSGEHVPCHPRPPNLNRITRGYERYPRFDFIYDGPRPALISVSVALFRNHHDTGSAAITEAFIPDGLWGAHTTLPRNRCQIEALLDSLLPAGASHTATCTKLARIRTGHEVAYTIDMRNKDGVEAAVDLVYVCPRPLPTKPPKFNKYDKMLFCFEENLPRRLKANLPRQQNAHTNKRMRFG